jgi:outer membrane lipoprotein SlyB
MDRKTVFILLILILIVIIITFTQQERATSTADTNSYSSEAIANIAKVYADTSGTAMFNNIKVTGNVTGNVNGDLSGNVKGNVTGNLTGNVNGNLTGNVNGILTGNIGSTTKGLLVSNNGKFQLTMQDNGDMAIYDVDQAKNIWAGGKSGIHLNNNRIQIKPFGVVNDALYVNGHVASYLV